MNETKFDPTKPCQTRDGRKVVIYCTDGGDERPIHGRIEHYVFPTAWKLDGKMCDHEDRSDIINTPPEPEFIEGWVEVYKINGTVLIQNLKFIETVKGDGLFAKAHFKVRRGEGLSENEGGK